MDRIGIMVVSLCVVLLIVWFVEEQRYAAQFAQSHAGTNMLVTAQTQTTSSNAAPVASEAPAVTTTTAIPAFSHDTNLQEQLLVLTNRQAHYTNYYTFTSRGGGLKSVDLLDYPETISPRWKTTVTNTGVATLNSRAPVPVMGILG